MRVGRSMQILRKRHEFLKIRLKEMAPSRDLAEALAIETALRCMELVISYGFSVVGENGPYLPSQVFDPDRWTNKDVNQMKKTLKNLKGDNSASPSENV